MRTSKICYSVSRLAWAVCEWLVELGEERTFRLLWSSLLNPQMQKLKPCKGKRQLCLAGRLRVSKLLLLPIFFSPSFSSPFSSFFSLLFFPSPLHL